MLVLIASFFHKLYILFETFLLILAFCWASYVAINTKSYYVVVIFSCLAAFSIVNNIYILLELPIMGSFLHNNFNSQLIFVVLLFISWSTILLFCDFCFSNSRFISYYQQSSAFAIKRVSRPHHFPLSLFIITSMYLIEFLMVYPSISQQQSYFFGGEYLNTTSGLSEYIAPIMAIYLIKLKKRLISFYEKSSLVLLFFIASIYFFYGMRSSASVVFLFLIFIAFQFFSTGSKKYSLSITVLRSMIFPAFIFVLIIVNMVSSSFRLALEFHNTFFPPINQFIEVLNSSVAFLSLPDALFGRFFNQDLISLLFGLFALSVPQQLFGFNAALNPLLPFKEVLSTFSAGGGGHVFIWFIYLFGPFFGCLVMYFFFKLLFSRGIYSELICVSVSLLAVRFCFYDPISVLFRTLVIGLLVYFFIYFTLFPARYSNTK